jgi:hypothetical protein
MRLMLTLLGLCLAAAEESMSVAFKSKKKSDCFHGEKNHDLLLLRCDNLLIGGTFVCLNTCGVTSGLLTPSPFSFL